MNFGNGRSVGEQVESGFRIAGFLLLAIVFAGFLLCSAQLLAGRPLNLLSRYPVSGRLFGACLLTALCGLLFFTVQYWAKWFFGFLVYVIFRSFFGLLAGFTVNVRPFPGIRLRFLGMFLTSLAQAVLCWKYIDRFPRRIEVIGLIAVVVSWSFVFTLDSSTALVIGAGALGTAQLISWRTQALTEKRKRRAAWARREQGQAAK